MPVFVDALIGDTLHLSAEEFGAYCLLLFATWRNNGRALLDDDEELARVCRITEAKWQRTTRAKMLRFFDVTDGTWHQKRLEREWEYVQKKAAISRTNGVRGGRPRKNPRSTPEETQQVFPENPAGFAQDTQTETTQPQPHTQAKNLSQPALGVSEPPAREAPAGLAGWLADFEISEEWIAEAAAVREAAGKPAVDLHQQARRAVDHWRGVEAPDEPHAAWIGWALHARRERANGAPGPDPPRDRDQHDAPSGPPPPLRIPP